jgi:hypothetical protein
MVPRTRWSESACTVVRRFRRALVFSPQSGTVRVEASHMLTRWDRVFLVTTGVVSHRRRSVSSRFFLVPLPVFGRRPLFLFFPFVPRPISLLRSRRHGSVQLQVNRRCAWCEGFHRHRFVEDTAQDSDGGASGLSDFAHSQVLHAQGECKRGDKLAEFLLPKPGEETPQETVRSFVKLTT